MFRDPTVNRRNAQLVITSHDVTVLRRLEREEIWFVEKASDGASTLSSLVEYNTLKDYAFDKQYLEGRYGGVPVIDDFQADRKSVVSGTNESVRVALGGRRILKKKK